MGRDVSSVKLTRREASLALLAIPSLAAFSAWTDNTSASKVLAFVESMRDPKVHPAAYRYAGSSPKPVLYASCYAVLTRDLFGDLAHLTKAQRANWIEYLQSFQSSDGLFRDPLLKSKLADEADWWGWRHLTSHVYWSLAALGSSPRILPAWLDPVMTRNGLTRWLDSLDWGKGVADSSNIIMNWGVGLLYAADVHHVKHAGEMASILLDELDARARPESGLWGPEESADYSPEIWRSLRVQAAYHLWLLYDYRKRKPPGITRAVPVVLATQNPRGGFGWGVHNPQHPYDGSACEDIDSVDPLARFAGFTPELSGRVTAAFRKARPWVQSNFDSQGGAVFCKGEPFAYGHPLMTTGPGEPTLFATWFRMLSIAFIDAGLGRSKAWRFVNVPGCQCTPTLSLA
jgi:hypothetical protein